MSRKGGLIVRSESSRPQDTQDKDDLENEDIVMDHVPSSD